MTGHPDGDDRGSRIDPYAYGLAENVKYWDAEPAFHLYEMLSHLLAKRPHAEQRSERLGLLIEMIAEGTGEVPGIDEYEERRTRANAEGAKWPSAAALAKSYLGWSRAVDAAMKTHFGTRQVRNSERHSRVVRAYTNAEILDAICDCRESIGFWPSQWEFQDWARLARALKRRAAQLPRIPGIDVVRKSFGSYAHALDAAQRHEEAQGHRDADGGNLEDDGSGANEPT